MMDDNWLEMDYAEITPLVNGTHSPDSPAIDHLPFPVKVCKIVFWLFRNLEILEVGSSGMMRGVESCKIVVAHLL